MNYLLGFVNEQLSDDYVYCDPPYLITCASYNEQERLEFANERIEKIKNE